MSDGIGAAARLTPIGAATVLAFCSGGYFIRSWGIAAVVVLTLAAVAGLMLDGDLGGHAGLVTCGGLASLAVWQGASSLWADEPAAAIATMNLTLLYAAAAVLALIGVRRPGHLDGLLSAVLVGATVVATSALAARLLPGLLGSDEQRRLAYPISYWNGLGAIAAVGTVVASGIAGSPGRRPVTRAACGAAVPVLLLTLLLTYSRGALAALAVATALLVALAPGRLETVAALVATAGASIPLLVVANGESTLSGVIGPLPEHSAAGRRVLVWLVLTCIVGGAASAGAVGLVRRVPAPRRAGVGWALCACAVVAVATVAVLRMPSGGPIAWADRQAAAFRSFDAGARAGATSVSDRLATSAGSGRWQNWGVAADEWRSSPIVGTGAGDYRFAWDEHRPIDLSVRNAHELYLEVAAESGAIGLVLLLLPLGAVAFGTLPMVVRPGDESTRRAVGCAIAAGAVIAVHAAGDWDWQLPAVTLPAIALGAGALKVARLRGADDRARVCRPWTGVAVATAALGALVMLAGPLASTIELDGATHAAAAGRLDAALVSARSAARLAPDDPTPWRLQGDVLADLGRPVASDRAFAEALVRSPRDWEIMADWATALGARGELTAAGGLVRRAGALNPREPRIHLLAESLSTEHGGS
jgi:hypothetical protein